jgi:hypothetical protein
MIKLFPDFDSRGTSGTRRRIVPLIMCGGAGTRSWPASREVLGHALRFRTRCREYPTMRVSGMARSRVRKLRQNVRKVGVRAVDVVVVPRKDK